MAHLDLETWQDLDREMYKSEVIDPGADYTGPCLDKLSKKKLAGMHASIKNMNYAQATECVPGLRFIEPQPRHCLNSCGHNGSTNCLST
eukprot:COSAG02_NODE_2397_length_8951_cov_3.254406_2_plen_89_part_00